MARSCRGWKWPGAAALVAVGLVTGVSTAGAQGVPGFRSVPIASATAATVSGAWAHPTSVPSVPTHTDPEHLVPPSAPRIGGVQNTAVSSNWSGQIAAGPTFSGIEADWTVPTVQPTQTLEASGTWIGIDGGPLSPSSIIQTGTAQIAQGGTTQYYAWYELFPANEVIIGGVSPGDQMEAQITQTSGSSWTIDIADVTTGDSLSQPVTYDGPGDSAEWIEELPTPVNGPTAYLANFGSTTFTQMGLTEGTPGTLAVSPLNLVDSAGNVIAFAGSLTGSPPSFTITYVPEPTSVGISASPAQSTLGKPVTYSAAVDSAGPPPTGAVAFTDGATFLCTATISNGTGSCSATNTPEGNDVVGGQYSGDTNSDPSNGSTYVDAFPHGYWLVGSDGGIFTFGSAQFYGSTGSLKLQRPVVGITPTANDGGYWLVASDGGIFSFNTGFYGSIPGLGLHPAGSGLPHSLNAPIVGMVPTAGGGGYFMVASDGGVFSFGDASFEGSCPGIGGCAGKAVAVAPDASGNGYWVVTSTGNVYTFGDAPYFGAPGPQSSAITSMVRTPNGQGYWILDADGQVFHFGNAAGLGGVPVDSTGGLDPASAIAATSDGFGYWVTSAVGAVYPFGNAPDDGSMVGTRLNGAVIAATGF